MSENRESASTTDMETPQEAANGAESGAGDQRSCSECAAAGLISEAVALLAIEESVLQSYRGVYVMAESMLLAATVVLISIQTHDQDRAPAIGILMAVGIAMCAIWTLTGLRRKRNISYWRQKIEKMEGEAAPSAKPMTDYRRFRKHKPLRRTDPEHVWPGVWTSPMTWIMDIGLPLVIAAAWVVLSKVCSLPYIWRQP